MKFHIVRTGENLEDILFLYNLCKDELVEENRHIRVWDKLVPGTKLKIPPITIADEQDIADMEPFVEDYYPKLSDSDEKEEVIFSDKEEEIKIDIEKGEQSSELIKTIDLTKTNEEEKKLPKVKTATKPQDKPVNYLLANYNVPRNQPYTYIFYPIYYQKRP